MSEFAIGFFVASVLWWLVDRLRNRSQRIRDLEAAVNFHRGEYQELIQVEEEKKR